MIPVDQTTFGFPGGNCFSACVASLLELPISDVPYFMDAPDTLAALDAFLEPHGFHALCMLADVEGWTPRGLHILTGRSPRAPVDDRLGLHSVVARGAEIVHDPHPSRAGIVTRHDVMLLIPLDPARMR